MPRPATPFLALTPRNVHSPDGARHLPHGSDAPGHAALLASERPGCRRVMVRLEVAARLALLAVLAGTAAGGAQASGRPESPAQPGDVPARPGGELLKVFRCEGPEGRIYQQQPCRHQVVPPLALPPAAGPVPEALRPSRAGALSVDDRRSRRSPRETVKGRQPTPAQIRLADERQRVQQARAEAQSPGEGWRSPRQAP